MKYYMKIGVMLVALILVGCSTSMMKSPEFDSTKVPGSEASFVFGQFKMIQRDFTGLIGASDVAILLKNIETGKEIYLPLKEEAESYVVSIVPGQYEVGSFGAVSRIGITKLLPFPSDVKISFEAKKGEMLYLGDFFGGIKFYGGTTNVYIEKIESNFAEQEFIIQQKYKHFEKLPKRDVSVR